MVKKVFIAPVRRKRRLFKCEKCNLYFPSKRMLKRHRQEVHVVGV